MKKKVKKPEFTITINDEYCTYEYPLRLSANYSIDDIAKEIFKSFNLNNEDGKFISSHTKR